MSSGELRRGCWAITTLAPRASRSAIRAFRRSGHFGDQGIAVESGIGAQRPEGEPVDERRHANRIEALPWQEPEAHEVAERVGERQDLGGQAAFGAAGGQAAFGAADGLALSPPFAPCPWRWTLTMVASTMAYSLSGSSETAANNRC